MKKNFRAKVDFLTFKLTEGFNARDMFELAKIPIVNTDDGEIVRLTLRDDQYSVNYPGGQHTTASFYRGGEFVGMMLLNEHDLQVTRIDLALDLEFNSYEECKKGLQYYDAIITDQMQSKGTTAKKITFEGRNNHGNQHQGYAYWARGGDKQLRLYAKEIAGAYFARMEWQIRGNYADQIAQALKADYPANQERIFSAFQEMTAMYLKPDIFGFGEVEGLNLVKPESNNSVANIQEWAINVVAKSFVRHFQSEKVKLWEIVSKECERIMLAQMNDQIAREQSYHDRKQSRYQHQVEKATAARKEVTNDAR